MTTKNIQDGVAERVKTFGNHLAFHLTPSKEAMKAVRWAREELEDTLTQLVKEVEGREREATIRDMERKMMGWAGTAKAMLRDYREIIYRTPPTSDVVNHEIPFVVVGNGELGQTVTNDAICPNCEEKHPVEYGTNPQTGEVSKMLAFVKCAEKAYLVGIDGKQLK